MSIPHCLAFVLESRNNHVACGPCPALSTLKEDSGHGVSKQTATLYTLERCCKGRRYVYSVVTLSRRFHSSKLEIRFVID